MNEKQIYVTFGSKKLENEFESLKEGKFEDKQLYGFINRAREDLDIDRGKRLLNFFLTKCFGYQKIIMGRLRLLCESTLRMKWSWVDHLVRRVEKKAHNIIYEHLLKSAI